MSRTRTNVYVDGFNLYYSAVKGTPYRWLSLSRLCALLLPGHHINRIRYFTARIVPPSGDPPKLRRQLTYIRALETTPNLSVHYGQFLTHPVWRPLVNPPTQGAQTVQVLDTKEKGSDVNLATCLLVDGFRKDYETAVVISSDSDLVPPIKAVQEELGLPVGVLHPGGTRSRELSEVAAFYRPIRSRALRASQSPLVLTDTRGQVRKPAEW